ncbi:MAG: phosphatidate cytidylyltransferase [Candidatus Marinimicrobia bacterium]|nr:phosphatidate cytidylyltransferase [Candidatus Neomarinimicrobiota bacterium]
MLWTRLASIVAFAPPLLFIVYLESLWFNALVGLIGIFIAFEYMRMTGVIRAGEKWHWRALMIIASPPLAVIILEGAGMAASLTIIVALSIILIVSGKIAGRAELYSVQVIIPYAAVPAMALAYVINIGGALTIFWLLAIVWATDIGAYAIGRTIGGPKLAPSISPNKTWSGAIGGVIAAVVAASALLWGYDLIANFVLGGLAAIISVISQSGDLLESRLKRHFRVKDSGNLIPGHGGVMDRFDGLWAAAPVMAIVCGVMQGGVQQW